MGERIEWRAVPGCRPEWLTAGLRGWAAGVARFPDSWSWWVDGGHGMVARGESATGDRAVEAAVTFIASKCRGETITSGCLPPWPYAAADADPCGERERFASSPGSRVPPPAQDEARPWVSGVCIVPAGSDDEVEMSMKALGTARTARVVDPALTAALGLPAGMTAIGVTAAARNLRAQRDRLERELAEAREAIALNKAQFDRLWLDAEAAHAREDALRRECASLAEQVISLQFDLRGLQELRIDYADRGGPEPAPARKSRPLACFKMPDDVLDGRGLAACDDPARHLDWSDDDE